MVKRVFRILSFPAVSLIWLLGWVLHNVGDDKRRTGANKNHSTFNSVSTQKAGLSKGTLKYDKA
jgi:hypothetical protein